MFDIPPYMYTYYTSLERSLKMLSNKVVHASIGARVMEKCGFVSTASVGPCPSRVPVMVWDVGRESP